MKERGNRFLKVADKYIGVPLIAFLGLLRITRATPQDAISRVLVIKTAGIGDTILLSAIIADLKKKLPAASILLVCTKSNEAAARLIPDMERVVVFDLKKPLRSLIMVRKMGKFELLMDFAPWARINALITYFVNADFKVGFKTRKMYRHYVYDKSVDHQNDIHEIENYRNVFRAVFGKAQHCLPKIKLVPEIDVGNFDLVEPYVMLHPFPGGTGKILKEWSENNWITLGKALAGNEYMIAITGGKEDKERAASMAAAIGSHCYALAGSLTLGETATLLKRAKLLVSVNTGIMHLADAMGVRTIALHGPTSPLRWGPIGINSTVVLPNMTCAPCINLGFEYGCNSGGCMATIQVEKIIDIAVEALK